MKRAILPTLMGMLCLIALSGCDLFKSEESKEYEVKYRVFGNCDSAISVIYKDETGTDITIDLDNPPWEYTFTAVTGTPTYIKARKLTSGRPGFYLDIAIDLNGDEWKHTRCNTAYCFVSLEGNLP